MGYLEDQTKQINDQYNAQLNNRLQQIQSARDQQINDFNKQMQDGSLGFHDQRVDLDTQKALEMKNSKEMMGGMGSYNSGDNITAMSKINNNRARGMNTILGSENQFNKDINYRIGQTRLNANNQEQDVRNTIMSEQAKALQSARDRAYQMEMEQQAQARAEAQRQAQAKAAAQKQIESAQKQAQAAAAEKADFMNRYNELVRSNNKVAKDLVQKNGNDIINRYGREFYNDVRTNYNTETRQIGKEKKDSLIGIAY